MADFIPVTGKNTEFIENLKRLIKLPDHCTRVQIDIQLNDVVRVTFDTIAEKGSGIVQKQYILMEEKKNG